MTATRPAGRVYTILNWGDTQRGKTSLGAAALFSSSDSLPAIDRGAAAGALVATLHTHWRRLQTGCPVQATSCDSIDLDLPTRAGSVVRLRDIRGQGTREPERDDVRRWLVEADAFLFILEWDAPDMRRQIAALEAAWNFTAGKPAALAFTKCERSMSESDPAWEAREGWWRASPRLSGCEYAIARFGEAVWPTSTYGYDAATGLPAEVLGEFGELIPCGIVPKGVGRPFEWLFSRLGVK